MDLYTYKAAHFTKKESSGTGDVRISNAEKRTSFRLPPSALILERVAIRSKQTPTVIETHEVATTTRKKMIY